MFSCLKCLLSYHVLLLQLMRKILDTCDHGLISLAAFVAKAEEGQPVAMETGEEGTSLVITPSKQRPAAGNEAMLQLSQEGDVVTPVPERKRGRKSSGTAGGKNGGGKKGKVRLGGCMKGTFHRRCVTRGSRVVCDLGQTWLPAKHNHKQHPAFNTAIHGTLFPPYLSLADCCAHAGPDWLAFALAAVPPGVSRSSSSFSCPWPWRRSCWQLTGKPHSSTSSSSSREGQTAPAAVRQQQQQQQVLMVSKALRCPRSRLCCSLFVPAVALQDSPCLRRWWCSPRCETSCVLRHT